jgi:hypothetical protein
MQSLTIGGEIYYYIGQKEKREREREREYSDGVKREHGECERVRKWERTERLIFFFVLAFLCLSRFCVQRFYPTGCVKRMKVGPRTEGLRGLDQRGSHQF